MQAVMKQIFSDSLGACNHLFDEANFLKVLNEYYLFLLQMSEEIYQKLMGNEPVDKVPER